MPRLALNLSTCGGCGAIPGMRHTAVCPWPEVVVENRPALSAPTRFADDGPHAVALVDELERCNRKALVRWLREGMPL